ncbi:MAG: sugar porter family MFS transporter [Verrucomicrobiales bacterium]|nr:sugar porter family MFS transporter [Verrucomicrobiales bacterium]
MKSSHRYALRIALVVAFGGFLMGFDASVISGVVGFIEPEFNLSKLQLGWAVSCLTLTATLGMMISGPLSDAIGRKRVLLLAALVYTASAILSAVATSFGFLVAARMLGGFAVGASLIVAPMYIAEMAPARLRGQMVSFNQLNIVIGISAAFFSNYLVLKLGQSEAAWAKALQFGPHNWRWMLGLETFPALFYFFSLLRVPESPRWLVMRGRDAEAQALLTRVSGDEAEARQQIESIQASLAEEAGRVKTPLSELFLPALRRVLVIGLVIAVIQQITGINAVFFYAPMIFEQSGIGKDAAFSQAVLVGLINLVFTLVAMALVDRLGRKPLLALGLTGITVSMLVLGGSFAAARYALTAQALENLPQGLDGSRLVSLQGRAFDSDVAFKRALVETLGAEQARQFEGDLLKRAIQARPLLILLGILGFVASFAVSVGPVMWILFSELFPNRVRGLAVSFVGFVNSAVSFLVQLVFPWELANWGSAATFWIYAAFAAIGLVFVLARVPETKGRTLEELAAELVHQRAT